jgi:hypothetical protein
MNPSKLELERHADQLAHWPTSGKHVLAQFDDETVVVYQAYKPKIGHHAAKHQKFGGGFSFDRMSWIKPNFLWMMYRSGWGTKVDQEVTLALRLTRAGFDEILSAAVASSFGASKMSSREDWQRAVASSDVRLQWDPDHGPGGEPLERRAIQLGLRGKALRKLNDTWLVSVEDISDFVATNRTATREALMTPKERVYPVSPAARLRLGM